MSEPEIIFVPDPSAEGDWKSFIEAAAALLVALAATDDEGACPKEGEPND